MKKKFSKCWKSSKQPRKQRKYRYNAPLHIKQKFMHAHLSRELRKKYGKRRVGLRKGDKVNVMRGEHRKYIGKVEDINLKRSRVYIEGIEITKKDGTKIRLPIDPSNLMIIELNLDDATRKSILERKTKIKATKTKATNTK